MNPHINDIYKKCVIVNNALMVNETYNNMEDYKNIGFYLDKFTMIVNLNLIRPLISYENRVFELYKGNLWEGQQKYISQELLELSQLKISPKVVKKYNIVAVDVSKNLIEYNKNIPYKDEVYFNDLISSALKDYSGIWYIGMNDYLREGDSFFNGSWFKRLCTQGISETTYDNNMYKNKGNFSAAYDDFDKAIEYDKDFSAEDTIHNHISDADFKLRSQYDINL